jgi:hypothetical protein
MKVISCAVLAVALMPSLAFAQNAGGAVGGAVVGGVVGGPIGAGIGAIVGSTLPDRPPVAYDRPVVVGEALPDDFTYYPVPNYNDYSYVVVDHRRVIVDRGHRVVRVIE